MIFNCISRIVLGGVSALALSFHAYAADIFVSDGEQLTLNISHDFPTRLSFKNDAGKKFIFNKIADDSPEITTTKGASGDVFVNVVTGKVGDVVRGFITTSQGFTYPVDVNIQDIRPDHVVVRNAGLEDKLRVAKAEKENSAILSGVDLPVIEWNGAAGHYEVVGLMMRALYYKAGFDGFKVSRKKFNVALSDKVAEASDHALVSESVVGLRMAFRNDSSEVLFLPDLAQGREDFIAVSFKDEALNPGDTTTGYIIKRRGGG